MLFDLGDCLDPGFPWHHKIHKDDIRLEGACFEDRFHAIHGFINYINVIMMCKQGAQTATYNVVIFGQ
jgi:hypothetical protein